MAGWTGCAADACDGPGHHPFGAVAAAAVYRRSAVEQSGLFHDAYFAYYEDTDLGIRLRLHGWDCTYVPRAVAYHAGSATGKKSSRFQRYYLRRNIELLYWVDMVGPLALKHLLPHTLYELAALAGMALRGQAGTFLRAKVDAVRLLPWILRERAALRRSLRGNAGLGTARRSFGRATTPSWKVLVRGENATKLVPPNSGQT